MHGTLALIMAAAVAGSSLLVTAQAHAETVNTPADLQSNKRTAAYLGSRPVQEVLYRLGLEQDRKLALQMDCKSQYEVKLVGFHVLSPIDFPDGKQNPTKGAWLLRYTFARCGDAKVYNALFVVRDGRDAPAFQAYHPGSSNAHPLLIKDAMPAATTLASSGSKECKNADVLDMRVTEPPHSVIDGKKEYKRVWSEMWTFKSCDRVVDVSVTFTPDPNGGGTAFAVKLPEGNARPATAPEPRDKITQLH